MLYLYKSKTSKSQKMKKTSYLLFALFLTTICFAQAQKKKEITDFVPKNAIIFEKIIGDLNEDGLADCVIIIKQTDKSKIIQHETRGKLDRNRRGIIILLNNKKSYEMIVSNEECFSSENEEGGVYFAPELSFEIKNSKLYVNYGHGRYGYWKYSFRLKKYKQNTDLELIGYDETNGGAVVNSQTSINFLTKKKIDKINTNQNAESGNEVFKETKTNIKQTELIRLSRIINFDELSLQF